MSSVHVLERNNNKKRKQIMESREMSASIPIGASVELRNNKDTWTVVSYYDNEMPKFCRQYNIMSLHTGECRRAFKHELFEKNNSTYFEVNRFMQEQMFGLGDETLLDEMFDSTFEELTGEDAHEVNLKTDSPRSATTATAMSPKLSNPAKSGRFKSVTDIDVDTLASKTTEPTTNSQTRWAVKLLKGINLQDKN